MRRLPAVAVMLAASLASAQDYLTYKMLSNAQNPFSFYVDSRSQTPAGLQYTLMQNAVERALGGVIYGWLKNKYWIDELYDVLFVRPAFWLARVFFTGVDRNVIDNVLHGVAWISLQVGNVFRDYFDRPVVNGASDGTGVAAKWAGRELRITQIGRVQAYLIMVMIGAAVIGVFMWTAR